MLSLSIILQQFTDTTVVRTEGSAAESPSTASASSSKDVVPETDTIREAQDTPGTVPEEDVDVVKLDVVVSPETSPSASMDVPLQSHEKTATSRTSVTLTDLGSHVVSAAK